MFQWVCLHTYVILEFWIYFTQMGSSYHLNWHKISIVSTVTLIHSPIYYVPFLPWDYVWRNRIMSTMISAIAQSKGRENTEKRHILILSQTQRVCYFTRQIYWCPNASTWIYQNGGIAFLLDTYSVIDCKFDFDVQHWTGRWQKSSAHENRLTTSMFFF